MADLRDLVGGATFRWARAVAYQGFTEYQSQLPLQERREWLGWVLTATMVYLQPRRRQVYQALTVHDARTVIRIMSEDRSLEAVDIRILAHKTEDGQDADAALELLVVTREVAALWELYLCGVRPHSYREGLATLQPSDKDRLFLGVSGGTGHALFTQSVKRYWKEKLGERRCNCFVWRLDD